VEIAELSVGVIRNAIDIFDLGFQSARGDSGVAISSAIAGSNGALSIVYLNLTSFKRSEWAVDARKRSLAASIALSLFVVSTSFAASFEKAIMLNQHGLVREAKVELIDIIFSKSADSSKAQAYYLLGSIAFEDNKITVALDSWREFSRMYPNSEQAKIVKDRINELAEIVGVSAKESIKNAVALSYLRHADFWSRGKDNKFTIDLSWIPNVETGIKWYDKVISEFPKSAASRVAYQDKMRTLLGWEEPGLYGSKYGIEESFDKYIPQLLETFILFEKEYPNASTL
jgi:tetratricopeptide (TPR) repeat protein